jgi:hypothetical protein
MFLQNTGTYLQDHTVSQLRTTTSDIFTTVRTSNPTYISGNDNEVIITEDINDYKSNSRGQYLQTVYIQNQLRKINDDIKPEI